MSEVLHFRAFSKKMGDKAPVRRCVASVVRLVVVSLGNLRPNGPTTAIWEIVQCVSIISLPLGGFSKGDYSAKCAIRRSIT